MLRFFVKRCLVFLYILKFQYILCYGSSRVYYTIEKRYVKFQYILCYGSSQGISDDLFQKAIFQYILCYGSSGTEDMPSDAECNFNTSYVTVLLYLSKYITVITHLFQYILCYGSSNTNKTYDGDFTIFQYILCYGSSYFSLILCISFTHFNTSYVTVLRSSANGLNKITLISIHPMLRFFSSL